MVSINIIGIYFSKINSILENKMCVWLGVFKSKLIKKNLKLIKKKKQNSIQNQIFSDVIL